VTLRKPRRNGATHLVLDPIHFLARIAAIIPPPRFPLVRFAGVFAPHSSWRALVVPKAPGARAVGAPSKAAPSNALKAKAKKEPGDASAILAPAPRDASEDAMPGGPRTSLGTGVAKPVGARIDWASLIRRVYLDDVLACPCGGRRRILADIQEPDVIVAILDHLGLPTEPPPLARARSPGSRAA